MRRARFGRVVNLGAAGAENAMGGRNEGPHMAGKAAVVSFTRTFAIEDAGDGGTSNAVSPGIVDRREMDRAEAGLVRDPEVPVGRRGCGLDVADAVLVLRPPESSFINGAVVTVAGGFRGDREGCRPGLPAGPREVGARAARTGPSRGGTPVPGLRAVLFDLGDTIMREETEEKDETRTTLRAELFPGMAELLRGLHGRGYPLGLVADTRPGTYRNVLGQHGLHDLFGAFAISEELGTSKPDARMFVHALRALRVPDADWPAVAMVGNNLSRDIRGANALGLVSVHLVWNARYPTEPAGPDERPRHVVRSAGELDALIRRFEEDGTDPPTEMAGGR